MLRTRGSKALRSPANTRSTRRKSSSVCAISDTSVAIRHLSPMRLVARQERFKRAATSSVAAQASGGEILLHEGDSPAWRILRVKLDRIAAQRGLRSEPRNLFANKPSEKPNAMCAVKTVTENQSENCRPK